MHGRIKRVHDCYLLTTSITSPSALQQATIREFILQYSPEAAFLASDRHLPSLFANLRSEYFMVNLQGAVGNVHPLL